MFGEKNLAILIREMQPHLNEGEYIFTSVKQVDFDSSKAIMIFQEKEGTTLIFERKIADEFKLKYSFIASWITLKIHSSLEAVGLTAAFSTELAKHNISCNVVAGYYHDHIFVDVKDEKKAVTVLQNFSKNY